MQLLFFIISSDLKHKNACIAFKQTYDKSNWTKEKEKYNKWRTQQPCNTKAKAKTRTWNVSMISCIPTTPKKLDNRSAEQDLSSWQPYRVKVGGVKRIISVQQWGLEWRFKPVHRETLPHAGQGREKHLFLRYRCLFIWAHTAATPTRHGHTGL